MMFILLYFFIITKNCLFVCVPKHYIFGFVTIEN